MTIKIPQFVTRYANYKIDKYLKNPDMKEEYKNENIAIISRAVRLAERGIITVDECMKFICDT